MNLMRKKILLSLGAGVQITLNLFLAFVIIGLIEGNAEIPLLQRLPIAWLYYWPKLILNSSKYLNNSDELVSFFSNIIIYSFLTCAFLVLRAKRKKPN